MKLADKHLILLSAAAQREDHTLEIPSDLDPAVAEKLVAKLAGAGLIEEVEAGGVLPVWRRVDEISFALRITKEGLDAIGVEEPVENVSEEINATQIAASKRRPAPKTKRTAAAARKGVKKVAKRKPPKKVAVKTGLREAAKGRPGTKLEQVKTLLARKRGASIPEMMEATSWLPHTTRAVLTGLRKRGFQIERESVKDKPTVYRITGQDSAASGESKRARAA